MDQQVDLSTVLWIIGIFMTIVVSLTGAVWALLLKNIERVRNNVADAFNGIKEERNHCDKKIDEVTAKVDAERKERTDKHDAAMERVFGEIEKTKDKTADLEVTVAGFGSVYVTRAEQQP